MDIFLTFVVLLQSTVALSYTQGTVKDFIQNHTFREHFDTLFSGTPLSLVDKLNQNQNIKWYIDRS